MKTFILSVEFEPNLQKVNENQGLIGVLCVVFGSCSCFLVGDRSVGELFGCVDKCLHGITSIEFLHTGKNCTKATLYD